MDANPIIVECLKELYVPSCNRTISMIIWHETFHRLTEAGMGNTFANADDIEKHFWTQIYPKLSDLFIDQNTIDRLMYAKLLKVKGILIAMTTEGAEKKIDDEIFHEAEAIVQYKRFDEFSAVRLNVLKNLSRKEYRINLDDPRLNLTRRIKLKLVTPDEEEQVVQPIKLVSSKDYQSFVLVKETEPATILAQNISLPPPPPSIFKKVFDPPLVSTQDYMISPIKPMVPSNTDCSINKPRQSNEDESFNLPSVSVQNTNVVECVHQEMSLSDSCLANAVIWPESQETHIPQVQNIASAFVSPDLFISPDPPSPLTPQTVGNPSTTLQDNSQESTQNSSKVVNSNLVNLDLETSSKETKQQQLPEADTKIRKDIRRLINMSKKKYPWLYTKSPETAENASEIIRKVNNSQSSGQSEPMLLNQIPRT